MASPAKGTVNSLRTLTTSVLCLVSLWMHAVASGADGAAYSGPAEGNQSAPPQPSPVSNGTGGTPDALAAYPGGSSERTQLNVFWENGLRAESDDGTVRFHIGGRFDFDNTWYQQTPTLPFALQDGAAMRRARLRADGAIGETVDFVTEVNFANIQDVTNEDTTAQIGSVGLTDFFVTFKEVPLFENVRLGHFKQPIGLEHSSSGNDLYYMERSPGHDAILQPSQFVTGVVVFDSYQDDRVTAALSLARVGKQTVSPFAFGTGPGKYAATGRLTALPFYEDDGRRLVHVGIGYNYSGTGDESLVLANRPLVRAGAGSQDVPNIVQTGSFFTPDPVQVLDGELAAVFGRFSMSAEYQLLQATNVFDQFSGGTFSGPRGDITYQGVYAEMGLFLSPGDYRRYDKKQGEWGRQLIAQTTSTRPRAGFFAEHMPVQLICRYTYLDLASGSPVLTSSSGVQAGWENDITAGLDWYINSQVHVIVNYVYTRLAYVDNSSGIINGLGCRFHLDF